jgi:hypothetical protein
VCLGTTGQPPVVAGAHQTIRLQRLLCITCVQTDFDKIAQAVHQPHPTSCHYFSNSISVSSPVLLRHLGAGEHSCVVLDAHKLVDHGLRSKSDTRSDA